VKHTGNQHGDIQAPQPGGDAEGARSSARDRFVIVPLPHDFDINAAFQSEEEPSEPVTSPIAPEGGANSDLLSHDRAKAPSVSVADLIENHVRLEWHEAVAIAQHLCRTMAQDPAANVQRSLVEPWNIEITNAGEVQVLPAGQSSDPLVKQVGRVLRALLQDSIAPAELRLVASQASFEVPGYSSVDQLTGALRRFERPGELDAIRAAFQRGLEAKFSASPTHARVTPVATPLAGAQSWTPKGVPPAIWSVPPRSRSRSFSLPVLAAAASILVAIALVIRLPTPTSEERPVRSTPELQGQPVETQPSSPRERREIIPAPRPPSTSSSTIRPAPTPVAPTVSHRVFRPLAGPTVSVPTTLSPRSTAPTQRPATTGDSLEAAERRAAGLLAAGRADEAGMIFDYIVMRSPLYQLDPAHSSPEALSAIRSSKRVLLPALARRHYQAARAAFDAGDYSLAIAEGEQAVTLLNDADIGAAPADLSVDVPNLVALASAVRTAEEERIYTIADPGVTPPRPLGRQLSTASLSRRSLQPTGRLEILVGRSCRVEAVKLDTPLNGYHDRMMVSAAKAWHYKPALRNGKPVRFSLVMSINLPDS
jgi:hypothetical protein